MIRLFPLLVCVAACSSKGKGEGPSRGGPADAGAAPVEVVGAFVGTISDGIEGTATVEARARALVRAQVAGTVSEVSVEEGDAVREAAALARVERPAFSEVLRSARSNRDKAARDVRALKKLAADGLVPAQQLTDARFALRQARLEVERLQKERGLETIRSPIDGVVTARHVQPGEAVAVGAPLFDVADVAALEVQLRLPERHLPRLRKGLSAELSAEGLGTGIVPGVVARIAPTVDARSGTVKVTVAIPDASAGAVRLRPGMYVRARIVVDVRDDAVLLPKRALVFEDDRAFAWRIVDGQAQRVALELGYTDRVNVQVLRPLKAGDQLVVFGQRGLEDGAAVRIVEAPRLDATAPGSDLR